MTGWRALRERYAVTADPLRTQRRLELVALLLAVVICVQLVAGLVGLTVTAGPAAIEPAADSLRVPPVTEPRVLAARERNDILSRPLFWVGRRPLEAVALAEEPGASGAGSEELSAVKLVGVFGDGDTAGVIVLVKDKKQRILRGEAVEGWSLKSIEPTGEAVFSRGARRETLSLQRAALSEPAEETPERERRGRARAAPDETSKPAAEPVSEPRARPPAIGKPAAERPAGGSLSLGPGAG